MSSFELECRYRFEAAHQLPRVPEGHRCHRLHGHSYEILIVVAGTADPDAGWVMDFADLDAAFSPVQDQLDHRLLNEIRGLENPTSEMLARWIWNALTEALPGLARVRVSETPDSACTYYGD
jgi:6-pyruvoyltetrahydropterin/6-carboxytetrahydropterin synthase